VVAKIANVQQPGDFLLSLRWVTLEETWLNHWLLFSNELVDTVHQFVIEKGSYEKFSLQRRKRRGTGRNRPFVEVTGEPSTPLLVGILN